MIELIMLDKNFAPCGILDTFSSLSWTRKYYDVGNFTLQITIEDYLKIKQAKYIYSNNFEETAKIESIEYINDISSKKVQLKGRFLEVLLMDRVIDTTQNLSDTTENNCRKLVTNFAISPSVAIRKIPKLKLGNVNGLGNKYIFQVTGENLMDELYTLAKQDELSIKVRYDFVNDELIFEVWQGKNRIEEQSNNTFAIFSQNFENIIKDNYNIDSTKQKNFAYVYGEGKGSERFLVEVDKTNGEDRKELYVDAKDLQQEDMTLNEYKEALRNRGIEKLAECNKVETADFSIDPNSNLIYKKDFDLGDICTYKNIEMGILVDNRIVEITEAYENNNRTLDIVFGDDYNLKGVVA